MKKDQNFKCRQKLWESFNAFAVSDIESSKEGKGCKRLVETTKSDLMVVMIYEALGKKRSYGEPSTRAL